MRAALGDGLEGRQGQELPPKSFRGRAEQLDLSPGGNREPLKGSCRGSHPGRFPWAAARGSMKRMDSERKEAGVSRKLFLNMGRVVGEGALQKIRRR